MSPDKFSDFFGPVQTQRPSDIRIKVRESGEEFSISPYVQITAGVNYTGPRLPTSLWAVPTERTIQFINDNMIAFDNDSIYFKLVVFDKTSTLYAVYNQIIGSRQIAYSIDNESLAFLFSPKEKP